MASLNLIDGAYYDDDGNIIITDHGMHAHAERQSRKQHIDEKIESTKSSPALSEAKNQISETMKEIGDDVHRASHEWKAFVRKIPDILLAPISMQRIRKKAEHSHAGMFLLDTIRFGATFAFIFLALFVTINYQSFWNIAKAELALTGDVETSNALTALTDAESPMEGSSMNTDQYQYQGDILAVLPPVGPPENRLVIPKLGKNIPIVVPPVDSLIDEDWVQFEKDVQASLRDGVVHYPGTAKPGQAGNFFVTGHSSYYPWDPGKYKDVFARLGELDIGDTYSVYYGGDQHKYRITEKYEVKPTNVAVLDQPTNKRIATLMTCTPIGTTLRRLIVQAEEINPVTGAPMHVGEKASESIQLPQVQALPI